MATYSFSLTFSTEAELSAHLELFGFKPYCRATFVAYSYGDTGEKRVTFARIDGLTSHETDMPLHRGK